jgi:hypothetical protein
MGQVASFRPEKIRNVPSEEIRASRKLKEAAKENGRRDYQRDNGVRHARM